MVIVGRIFKESGGWSAHCDLIGVYTQGPTRKEAEENLAEATEMMIGRPGFKVTISADSRRGDDGYAVFIDSEQPHLLVAEVLKNQRVMNALSQGEVAKLLGASSVNAYAAYEQGTREPTLSKLRELLAVVAPDTAVMVGSRTRPKQRRKQS